jgi:hypothetical protein
MALLILPAATLGLMVATEQATGGKFPMPTVLMVAFRAGQQRLKAMLLLGLLYAFSFLAVMALTTLVDGGSFAKVYLANAPITPEVVEAADFQMAIWLSTLLYIPMSMMFWHAPALVHWYGIPPVKSMFFSAVACWRNLGAFAVYLLAWAGVFVAGAAIILTISSAVGGSDLTAAVLMPGALLMSAMFFTSVYFSVKDCFDLPLPGSETQA